MINNPQLYTVSQMAQVLGISRNTAYNLVHSKGFPAIHLGDRIRIPVDALAQWIESQPRISPPAQQ